MIKTFMKHTLLEYCITVACDHITVNFTTPKITDVIELFHKHWRNLGVHAYNQLHTITDYGGTVHEIEYLQRNYDRYQQRYIAACEKFKIIPRKLTPIN